MNQTNPKYRFRSGDEINLAELLILLLERKRLILAVAAVAFVLSFLYTVLAPGLYTATARILPPAESGPSLSGLLSEANNLAGNPLGTKSPSDVYVGILESRSVADAIVKKFKLMDLYDQASLDRTYETLAKRTKVEISSSTQIISVSVEDENPERAASMANAYLDALDRINRAVNITGGHRKRVFLEDRLHKVREDLDRAESALKDFQEKYKLVSITDQARASIEGASRIKGEIIAAQTQLKVLGEFSTGRNNDAVMLKSRIKELGNQLERIESGNPVKESLFIPLKEIPAVGMQLAGLMREAKIQEEVFRLITNQYELAKIEEAKDVNTIQVLDRAIPPDTKSSPKRLLVVSVGTLGAFFLAVFLCFLLGYIDHLKTEDRAMYEGISHGLKSWKSERGRADQPSNQSPLPKDSHREFHVSAPPSK